MEIVESSRLLSPFGFEAVPQGLRVPMATSGLGRAWLAWSTAEARAAWQDQAPPPPWGASPEETARGIRETLEDGYGHRTSSHIRRGNPRRAGDMGIAVDHRVPLQIAHNPYNKRYLATKAGKLGHLLGLKHQAEEE